MAIFIFFGSAFLLYVKARQGPGPFLFASVFGCICLGTFGYSISRYQAQIAEKYLDITLTTAALFPYPYYVVSNFTIMPYRELTSDNPRLVKQ